MGKRILLQKLKKTNIKDWKSSSIVFFHIGSEVFNPQIFQSYCRLKAFYLMVSVGKSCPNHPLTVRGSSSLNLIYTLYRHQQTEHVLKTNSRHFFWVRNMGKRNTIHGQETFKGQTFGNVRVKYCRFILRDWYAVLLRRHHHEFWAHIKRSHPFEDVSQRTCTVNWECKTASWEPSKGQLKCH